MTLLFSTFAVCTFWCSTTIFSIKYCRHIIKHTCYVNIHLFITVKKKVLVVAQHQMHLYNTKINFLFSDISEIFQISSTALLLKKREKYLLSVCLQSRLSCWSYYKLLLITAAPLPRTHTHAYPGRHLQPVHLAVAEDKNLVLVLTPLAATIKHCGSRKTSWGLFLPQITRLSPYLILSAFQCRSVFCAQVLEMPGFGRDDRGAKLNVAELCWQIRGSHCLFRWPPSRRPPS